MGLNMEWHTFNRRYGLKKIIVKDLDGECYTATTNKNAWLGWMGNNKSCSCGNTLFWNEYEGGELVGHQCAKCGNEYIH